MEIKIPVAHREAFRRVAEAEAEQFDRLVEALQKETPCLDLAELRRRVEQSIAPVMPGKDAFDEAIVSLATSSSRFDSGADLVQSVAAAVASSESLDAQKQASLRSRLEILLKIPLIHVSAKSVMLQVAHDRVYNASKIITDLRPVFREPLGQDWVYIVIHHLQVTCMRNGRSEEVYISMDDNDLQALHDAAVRAKEKAKALRSALQARQLHEIDGVKR